jgi:nucleoside-diphosphate-sugar epimerase
MKIAVTGGAGFIGSNLADALIANGHKVTIIDNLITGKRENIPSAAEFQEIDIASPVIDKVFERGQFDIMYHMAAQMDVRKSVENPAFDVEINILGGINLLQACVKHKVKKVIFSSTGGAIYGDWPGLQTLGFNEGLPITTDYRRVIADVLTARAYVTPQQINATVFPGLNYSAGLGIAVPK